MKNSDKVLIGVGLGLLAGGIAGYFLASEEGQKMQKVAKEKLNEFTSTAQQTLKEKSAVIGEKLSTASETAKDWVNEASTAVKNKISNTADTAEDAVENVEDSFKEGVDRARRNINEKTDTIDGIVGNV